MSGQRNDGAGVRRVGTRLAMVSLLAAAALGAACSTAASRYDRRGADYDAELQAYLRCNMDASRRLALQHGEISDLAAKAYEQCLREEETVRVAIRAAYLNPILVWDILRSYKTRVTRMNVEWIERERARRPVKRGAPTR